MKNLLKITLLFLAASFLFISCKNMSVTKRHYNRGYYVSHSTKKNKVEVNSVAKNNLVQAEQLAPKKVQGINASTSNPELLASNSNIKTEKAAEVKKHKEVENKIKYAGIADIKFKDVYKHPFKVTKMVAAKDNNSDGLSLIWILIVVILLIYLLSFLFEGFGLGNLIHVLAIIALVLLILWLLKVI